MTDLIDREALLEEIQSWAVSINNPKMLSREDTLYLIAQVPTISPESLVKHGRWIHDINNLYGCSECLERETMSPKRLKPYCPHCGAKMDLEAPNEA